jgi:hypothetical protein
MSRGLDGAELLDMRERAVALAELGLRVHPIAAGGKKPPTWTGFPERATCDPAEIRAAWSRGERVESFNPAVATGKGLLVIDIDVKDFPEEDRPAKLQAIYSDLVKKYELPTTWAVKTPSGGRHLYLRMSPGLTFTGSVKRLAPTVDVRAWGNYVLAPGAEIQEGAYSWTRNSNPETMEMAEAPQKLIDACMATGGAGKAGRRHSAVIGELDRPDNIDRARGYLTGEAPILYPGGRDEGLYRAAARVLDFGVSEATALELMEDYNESKVEPPVPFEDLAEKVENAWKHRRYPVGVDNVFDQFEVDEAAAAVARNEEEWPEPEDLWADVADPPDLARGILPAVMDEWADDEAVRLGVPFGAVATPALVACAAALSARWRVQVKQFNHGHTERAVLWAALIGEPGARKSPTLSKALGPLNRLEERLRRRCRAEQDAHRAAKAEWSQKAKQSAADAGPEPTAPKLRRKIANDVTIEAVAKLLADNVDGLLCFQDELAAWLGGMDAYRAGKSTGSKDQPFWLQTKNGGDYAVDRASREPIFVPVNAVHVLGGIQPDVLRKLGVDLNASGLLQRFLLAYVPRGAAGLDRAPNERASEAMQEAVELIAGFLPTEFDGPFRFCAEGDAARLRVIEFVTHQERRPDRPPAVKQWLSKAEGEWARVALVLHVLDWATGAGALGVDERPGMVIHPRHAHAAAAFIVDYQFAQQLYFYSRYMGLAAGSDDEARGLAGHILAHGLVSLTDREIQQKRRATLSGQTKRQRRVEVMNTLELLGWARPCRTGGDGRPSGWKINPDVFVRFSDRAVAERDRRAAQQRNIAAGGALRASAE